MTIGLATNMAAEWQYECLPMSFNSNVETTFDGNAAVAGKGYVIEKYQEIDWQSCYVFVQTVEGTGAKTINIGILSSEYATYGPYCFVYGASIATAGWVRPAFTVSQGTNAAYLSANTLGYAFKKGQDGANTAEHNAIPVFQNFIGDGTYKTMTYTCATTSASFVGFFWFRTRRLPDLTTFLK
jgi:hypothetical protein